ASGGGWPPRLSLRNAGARLGRTVEDRVDLVGDLLDARHAVDTPHQAALLVERQDRGRFGPVFGHARADCLLIVVRAALELSGSADVADAFDLRLLEAVMVRRAAIGAGEATDDAVDQRVFVDLQLDHVIEAAAAFGQQNLQGFGLMFGPREAVEDRAGFRRGIEAFAD